MERSSIERSSTDHAQTTPQAETDVSCDRYDLLKEINSLKIKVDDLSKTVKDQRKDITQKKEQWESST